MTVLTQNKITEYKKKEYKFELLEPGQPYFRLTEDLLLGIYRFRNSKVEQMDIYSGKWKKTDIPIPDKDTLIIPAVRVI